MRAGNRIISSILPALVLLAALPAVAQLKSGQFSNSLSGNVGPGYTSDWGNGIGSSHNWNLTGDANLNGSYYNPNFLSYSADILLNQSRANSSYQSISQTTGFGGSATLFGGSHYPGSIYFTDAFDSEGNYAVPGLANFVTHGNNRSVGANWAVNLPDAPSITAGYQQGDSRYSIYGTSENSQNNFKNLNVNSSYMFAGFKLSGGFGHGDSKAFIPGVVTGQLPAQTNGASTYYNFSTAHVLPLQGNVSANFSRNEYDNHFGPYRSNGVVDLISAYGAIHPLPKLYLSGNANLSDNLYGQLMQSIIAGGGVPDSSSSQSSSSASFNANATYDAMAHLQVEAYSGRTTQSFAGKDYGETAFGGGVHYTHNLKNGAINAALLGGTNSGDRSDSTYGTFSTFESYSGNLRGYDFDVNFNYAQNVQTLLVTYLNSYYNYSGRVRHPLGKLHVNLGASAAHSGLTQHPEDSSSSQSYDAGVGYDGILNVNGSYSRASGAALETGLGLVPIGGNPAPSSLVALFGGTGYSVSMGSAPVRGLSLSASYAKSSSNTTSQDSTSGTNTSFNSLNRNEELSSMVMYRVRKLYFTSGYTRLQQGFSSSGEKPVVLSTFYIGVSRWFKFF